MKKFKILYTVCYVCAGLLFGAGCGALAWAYCDITWRITYHALQASPYSVLWYLLAFLPAVAAVAVLGRLLELRYLEEVEKSTAAPSQEKGEEDSAETPDEKGEEPAEEEVKKPADENTSN